MLNWIRSKIIPKTDTTFYLPFNFCKGQSNADLMDKLKYAEISVDSKLMIMTELLDRTVVYEEDSQPQEIK